MRRVALDQADLVWRLSFGDGLTGEEAMEFIRWGWLPDSEGDVVLPYNPAILQELSKHMVG